MCVRGTAGINFRKVIFSSMSTISIGQLDNELNVILTFTAMPQCSSIQLATLTSNHKIGALFKINHIKN